MHTFGLNIFVIYFKEMLCNFSIFFASVVSAYTCVIDLKKSKDFHWPAHLYLSCSTLEAVLLLVHFEYIYFLVFTLSHNDDGES